MKSTAAAKCKNRFFIAIIYFFISCSNEPRPDLAGIWEIDELTVNMHTYQNSDSGKVVKVTGKDWEEKMKIRNIQTHYNSDGTYHSVHRNLQDSIFYDPAGKWKIENDSLIIQDTIPQRMTYKFKIKLGKSSVEYWGLTDFDQDGKEDDEYYSRQRRIN
jgi:hypothetical protein